MFIEGCSFRVRRAGLTLFAVVTLAFAAIQSAQASSVNLTWDPSPTPGVIGYKIHFGNASGNYSQVVSVTNATTTTISGLPAGTTFFAATALDASGLESDVSNEVSQDVPRVNATNFVEAETGVLTAPMAAAADAGASGGQYVTSTTDESGSVSISFN